jgi:hypothetical protein
MPCNRIEHWSGRRPKLVVTAAALTAGVVAAVTTPTAGHAAGASLPTRAHQHCVIALKAGVAAQRCFASAAEAIAYGSGGQVRVAADATTHDAVIALRAHDAVAARPAADSRGIAGYQRSLQQSNIIGIEYDGSNRSGAAKYFSVSGDCYSGAKFGFPKLSSYGWNDRINSAQTFVGCVGQHYDDTYYSDTMVSVFGSKDDFGGQNNKTSSIKFI